MENRFDRTKMLIGQDGLSCLSKAKVLIFGIGGVGGYVAEALARSGIGYFELVDNDKVSVTNINRQIIATDSTIGMYKTEIMRNRILDINPEAKVTIRNCFYLPENSDEFDFSRYDYIVDAIDTVTAKLDIVEKAGKVTVPVISCMGTGNKLDPTKLVVTDIYKTSVCPLAKVMRRELRKRGIASLKVVYSTEEPIKNDEIGRIPGSVAWVPPTAGLIAASEVVKDLINKNTKE